MDFLNCGACANTGLEQFEKMVSQSPRKNPGKYRQNNLSNLEEPYKSMIENQIKNAAAVDHK